MKTGPTLHMWDTEDEEVTFIADRVDGGTEM